MSWWDRLLRRETRSATSNSFRHATGIFAPDAPAHVSAIAAENLASVLACVTAISSTLAGLPIYAYRVAPGGGRTEAPDHPIASLLRHPHPRLPWPDLMEWWAAQTLLYGNGVLEQVRDPAGRVIALEPVPWPSVAVMRLPSGRLRYDFNRDGVPRQLMEEDVLHLRDRSDDGLVGRSRLSRAADTVSAATDLQKWTVNLWRNQGTPSGAIKAKGPLKPDAHAQLRENITKSIAGARNAGRILILDNDTSWESMSISPEDAEVLASRRFSVEEICRIFSVPPPIVQDYTHNTFTNASQASTWFATLCLTPWARKIEACMAAGLFATTDAGMSIEVDLSGLLRGDAEARWQSHKIAVEAGILDPDEIREIEGWGPRKAKPSPGSLA
ncbi:MAG: phage portal protein [Acetobacteraceae bacterium]|nr:phage portal protein [Acetobacteraceae bacterium]